MYGAVPLEQPFILIRVGTFILYFCSGLEQQLLSCLNENFTEIFKGA